MEPNPPKEPVDPTITALLLACIHYANCVDAPEAPGQEGFERLLRIGKAQGELCRAAYAWFEKFKPKTTTNTENPNATD